LESYEDATNRLKSFVEKAAQATLTGDVFDDAATGQGLLNYFLRALNCGAISVEDALKTGLTIEKLGKRKIGQVFGFSILLTFVAALNLALFVGPQLSVADAALAGLMVGLGWLAPFWGVVYLFEMRSLKLFLINAGYCTVSLTAMGVIIGAWH